jgi:hypothetical protein
VDEQRKLTHSLIGAKKLDELTRGLRMFLEAWRAEGYDDETGAAILELEAAAMRAGLPPRLYSLEILRRADETGVDRAAIVEAVSKADDLAYDRGLLRKRLEKGRKQIARQIESLKQQPQLDRCIDEIDDRLGRLLDRETSPDPGDS